MALLYKLSLTTIGSIFNTVLTPHVFYGDERDHEKWEALQEEMNLKALKERGTMHKLLDGKH